MDVFLTALAPFIVFFVIFFLFAPERQCPTCGSALPRLVSPLAKTRRQWLEGGWICPSCGTDVDWKGRRVETSHTVDWTRTASLFSVLALLTAIALGLVWLVVRR